MNFLFFVLIVLICPLSASDTQRDTSAGKKKAPTSLLSASGNQVDKFSGKGKEPKCFFHRNDSIEHLERMGILTGGPVVTKEEIDEAYEENWQARQAEWFKKEREKERLEKGPVEDTLEQKACD